MNFKSLTLCTLLTINTGSALSLPGQTWCSKTYDSLRYAIANTETDLKIGGLASLVLSALCFHLYKVLGAQEDQLAHEHIENYDATVAELQNQALYRSNFYEIWHVDIEALYRQSGISPEIIKQLGSLRNKEALCAMLGVAIPTFMLMTLLGNLSYLSKYYKSHELGQKSSLLYSTPAQRMKIKYTFHV